ncbi:MAG: type II toxin-antitoxin system RelE/ParE family toxin [Gammaproteobacteria bacterium]|nr:type II toxin-antitoxin system RelE/ParE family toxin [Gammaproteobacteria bacterium]
MKIAHRGLRRFHERGDASRLNPAWVPRIRRVLALLDQATEPRHLAIPGFGLHPLKGRLRGHWGVSVSGNWRIVFRFEGGEAVEVRLIDYH